MSLQSLTEQIKTIVGTDSGLDASVKFVTDEGVIVIDAKQVPNVVSNEDAPADCTLEISTSDALDMLSGSLNPMMAYMNGKLKIDGDMGVAMKIAQTFGG
ncbi:SCP2 sterol-binding domain-containing protein [Runella salmonicolor]|uniref:SCP2 sterol-binding domain-containing protein n=1 Tax=Runella salmonicolor TaxID=2950278 RepID=A0ABT1FI18_9BACT|nr:SCP2 sterol-binding domain-containing protein [Runella salmonicolor]MCP1381155.1 SCP2 sterol-binding domain-containing protein [Runella salmonicolor]